MSQTKAQLIDPVDGTIVNADINASAAIAGTKISPNFGSQNTTTTGIGAFGELQVTSTAPKITFFDSDTNPDFEIRNLNGVLHFKDVSSTTVRMQINADGHVDVAGNLDVGAGLDVTGAITGTGAITMGNGSGLNFGNTSARIIGESGASGLLRFDTNGGEKMRIDSSGRLMLGTTSVTAVPIATTNRNPQAEIVGSLSGSNHHGSLSLRCTNDSANLYLGSGLTSGTRTAGSVVFLLNDGTDYHAGGRIDCANDDTTANNDTPGRLVFFTTADGASSPTERMRIDSSGRLMVNTTTLSQSKTPMLEVKSDSNTSADHAAVFSSANGTSGVGVSYSMVDAFNNTSNATLRIRTNGSDAVHISETQNVGIGTTNPGQKLEVRQTAASHAIIAANRANSDTFAVALGNTSGGQGVLSVNNADLVFGRDLSGTFTERMRMLNGGGLTFNGDTAAANALDDYEEGTFTPTFTFSGVFNGTISLANGTYTKIGRMVNVNLMIGLSSKGSHGGNATVSLPFVVADILAGTSIEASGFIGYFNHYNGNVSALGATAQEGTSGAILRGNYQGGNSFVVTNSNFQNSTEFRLSVTYATST